MFVPVSEQTNIALEDIGEQRSPKKIPDNMAPAVSSGFNPAAFEIIMQITPMVLLVPKEVPVKNDIIQHKRKVHNTKYLGLIRSIE